MSTICNPSGASGVVQLPSSSFIFAAEIKCILQAVNVKSCDCVSKHPCSCLLILLQLVCKHSKPVKIKKEQSFRAEIPVDKEKCRRQMLKSCCRKRSIREHFNTAEDHHRWLYQKALLANFLGSELLKLFESPSSFNCLYENLRRDGYFKYCAHLCKKSVCCEVTVLKELKRQYQGENSLFLPLMRREMSHFAHYIRLKDHSIQSEAIALIAPKPPNSANLLSRPSRSASESPSGHSTNFSANNPSKFDIGNGFIIQISNEEEEESESASYQYWSSHFQSDFKEIQRQIQRQKESNYELILITRDKMYEEMLEQHERMLRQL